MNGDDRPGPASSESRHLSLEERMQTVPASTEPTPASHNDMLSRIEDSRSLNRPQNDYFEGDIAGEAKRPRKRGGRTHNGGGAGPARGRGGAIGTNGRGRGKNLGPGGHRRNMSSDGSSGAGLLGRMSGP